MAGKKGGSGVGEPHHFRREAYAWRLVWVILREREAHREDTTLPSSVVCPKDGATPHEEILVGKRARADALRWILFHCLQVAEQTKA